METTENSDLCCCSIQKAITAITKKQRNLVKISEEDYIKLRELFNQLNVKYIISSPHQEAENLCSLLVREKHCDAILTEDTDCIAYGASKFLFGIDFRKETVSQLILSEILDSLNLTYEQLRDFCILCGSDYNNRIPKVGPSKAFELIQKYENIETIDEKTKFDCSVLTYSTVRTLFDCYRFHSPSTMTLGPFSGRSSSSCSDSSELMQINSEEDSNDNDDDTIDLYSIDTKKYLFCNNIYLF